MRRSSPEGVEGMVGSAVVAAAGTTESDAEAEAEAATEALADPAASGEDKGERIGASSRPLESKRARLGRPEESELR